MSKEEIKSILIDLICDYDPERWSNEDVYCKYADLIYDKIENSNAELKEKYLNISHIDQMKKISDLEAKLAESEKSKEGFKTMYFNKCLDYEHLHEKLDDKCAEFELKEYDYKQTIFEKDQDKISFAVEQLEKVKEYWLKHEDVSWYIDNQIEELKKEMK